MARLFDSGNGVLALFVHPTVERKKSAAFRNVRKDDGVRVHRGDVIRVAGGFCGVMLASKA